MTRKPNYAAMVLSLLLIFFSTPLFSQDSKEDIPSIIPLPGTETTEIDWNQIHFAGVSFQQNYKTIDAESGDDAQELKYSIRSFGINYGSFSGSRLGFYSDLYLLVPFKSRFESSDYENNTGFSLDYMGTVGWNLRSGSFGFLPFIGFHTQYTFLKKDPLDDNQSNHMLSVGVGAGIRVLFKIQETNNIYAGIKGSIDTIEFTNASYDSREIQLRNKISYMLSMGYAYRAATVKRVFQSEGNE